MLRFCPPSKAPLSATPDQYPHWKLGIYTCITHGTYRLTCDDLAHLANYFDSRCGICDGEPHEIPRMQLFIDHNRFIGAWAVRGLLCALCNTRLQTNPPRIWRAEAAEYLRRSWLNDRFGDLLTPKPEPGLGARILVNGARIWHRRVDGWRTAAGGRCASWDDLNERYGPHRVEITYEGDS